jgi:tetratricopeptide (TPR) repeat protein
MRLIRIPLERRLVEPAGGCGRICRRKDDGYWADQGWVGMFERRRENTPEPEIEFGPNGAPTAQSLTAIEHAAHADHVVSMANFGIGLYQRGEHAEGVRWLKKAWQAGNAGAAFNLGTIYLSQGDTDRADIVWGHAADQGDPDAMVGLIRLALQRDDHTAAIRWLKHVLDQDTPFPITATGVAFRDHGDDSTALQAFNRAIDLGDPYAMQYAARLLEAHGHTADAAELRARAHAVWRSTGGDDSTFR